MNRVKHLAVVFLVFVMCFGMVTPVFADNTADYTFEMKELVQSVYVGGVCTVSYWHPVGYPNVWVAFRGNNTYTSGDLHIYFYDDETTITAGSKTTFSKEVYAITVSSKAEMEEILFYGNTADFSLVTSGVDYSNSLLYSATSDPSYRKNGSVSLESYYYNWYFEKHGVYPVGVNIKLEYLCNGEIIETQVTETIAGTDLLLQDIIKEPEGYVWDTITIAGESYEKADYYRFNEDTDITIIVTAATSTDNSGLISKLDEFMKMYKESLSPDTSFLDDVQLTILENLEQNSMYNSILYITNTLQSLFTEDYTKYSSYKENTVLKINSDTTYKPTPDGNSYVVGSIDWGLDNAQILDLSWYFGNHPYANETTGQFINVNGGYAVKYYSDTVISGFLWLVFGWYVFHNLPDLISGEIGQVTAVTKGVGAKNQSEAQAEQRKKEKEYNESYDAYKKKQDKMADYKARYEKEKGGK